MRALVLILASLFVHPLNAYGEEDHRQLIAFLADQKVIGADGSPIRVAREDWALASQLVVSDPAWGSWLAAVRRPVDHWIRTTKDRVDWIAGDMHELLDPVSKAPLIWSLDLSLPDGTGEATTKTRQAWVAWFRNQNFYMIQEAARLFVLTGEERYADWAVEQIDFYAAHYANWPLRNMAGRARMMGQGLDEATACVPLLDAVRLLKGRVSVERMRTWSEKLFFPMARQFLASRHADNIRLWHSVATAMIGMQFRNEHLVNEGLNGERGVRALIRKGVTADYFWYEGSLGYQAYVLRALGPLFVHASLTDHWRELRREMLIAQNMLLAPLLLRFDDGMLPTPGDSRARLRAVDPGLYIEFFRTLPNIVSLREASSRRNWQTLVDPVKVERSNVALPEITSKVFESIRMSIIRRNKWQVFLRYGQLVKNHSQQDALSTEIYFGNTPVSVVPSTVLYGAPLHEEYLGRGISRNSMLVDGEGQVGVDVGTVEAFGANGSYVVARQPLFRPDSEASRRIEVRDGVLFDRSQIALRRQDQGQRRLGFLFHTDCDVEANVPPLVGYVEPPKGTGFSFWSSLRVQSNVRSSTFNLICAEKSFEVQFDLSDRGAIYVGMTPTKPIPRLRRSFYIEILGSKAVLEMHLKPVHQSVLTE